MFFARIGISIIIVAGLLKTTLQEIDWSSFSFNATTDYKYTIVIIAYLFCLYTLWDHRAPRRWNTIYSVWIARLGMLGYLYFTGQDFYEAFSTSGINFTDYWYLVLRLLVMVPLTIYMFVTPLHHLIVREQANESADG